MTASSLFLLALLLTQPGSDAPAAPAVQPDETALTIEAAEAALESYPDRVCGMAGALLKATCALSQVTPPDLEPLAARVAQRLGLASDVAETAVAAAIADMRLLTRDEETPLSLPRLDAIEAAYARARAAAPASPALLEAFALHWSHWQDRVPSIVPRMSAAWPAGVEADRLVLEFDYLVPERQAAWETLRRALRVRPGHPALLRKMALSLRGTALGVALRHAALAQTLALATGHTEDATDLLAAEWIDSLLDAGLAREAVGGLRTLPAVTQATLREGRRRKVTTMIDGLPVEGEIADLRPPLAAARWLTGERDDLAHELAALPTSERTRPLPLGHRDDNEERQRSATQALGWEVLGTLLRPSGADSFPLLRDYALGHLELGEIPRDSHMAEVVRSWSHETCVQAHVCNFETVEHTLHHRGVWHLVAADLAHRDHHDGAAEFFARRATGRLSGFTAPVPREAWSEVAGTQALAEAARLSRHAERWFQRWTRSQAHRRHHDPARSAVREAVTSPPPSLFVERPLPGTLAPVSLSDEETKERRKQVAEALNWPEGFQVVRYETHGPETIAIATAQDYDPVGEVSLGGYWVLRTRDGGGTFDAPLYTGLRQFEPYVVREASDWPLVQGDRLSIEVEVRELDAGSICFPPVHLGFTRQERGRVVELALTELERDTDADGLTDIAEGALFTDPRHPDTDRDGDPDGVDPLPQVPRRPPTASRVEALRRTIVERFSGGGRGAIVADPDAPSCSLGQTRRPTFAEGETVFMVASRAGLGAAAPARRVVVIEEEELRRLKGWHATFLPHEIDLVLIDHQHEQAIVIWNAGWRGGTWILRFRDGRWQDDRTSALWMS